MMCCATRSKASEGGLAAILTTALWLFMAACAGPRDATTTDLAPTPTREDGLVHHPIERGKLLIDPDSGVDGYDSILVRRAGFSFAEGEEPLSDAERARLIELLTENRRVQIAGLGQLSASEPGPCTLSLDVFVLDLELYQSSKPRGSQTSVVSSYGGFTFVTQLSDSLSSAPIISHGVRYGLGGGVEEGRVRRDLDRLARSIERSVRGIESLLRHGIPLTPMDARSEFGCEGRVGMARRAALER